MAIELDAKLRWVLNISGYAWPAANEDHYNAMAERWRSHAAGLGEHVLNASWTLNSLKDRNEGPGLEAMQARMASMDGSLETMRSARDGCLQMATACEVVAGIIVGVKVAVMGQLVILAAAIIAAVASGGVGSPGVAIARQIGQEIVSAAIEAAVMDLLSE